LKTSILNDKSSNEVEDAGNNVGIVCRIMLLSSTVNLISVFFSAASVHTKVSLTQFNFSYTVGELRGIVRRILP